MTRAREAVAAPAVPEAAPAPAGAPSMPLLLVAQLARSAPEERKRTLESLSATAGNRSVTRLLARTPGKSAGADPAPYPFELRTERTDVEGGYRISQWGIDPSERLKPGQKPTQTEVFWVEFTLDETGTMKASARTVDPTGKYRSPTLRLKEQMRLATEHFESRGGAKHFEGDWSWMSPTEPSANLKSYNAARKTMSPEDAARQTPSGKAAIAAGFVDVRLVSDKPEKNEDIGDGKEYQRVRVRFSRPGPGTKPQEQKGGAAPPARPPASGSSTKTSTRVGAGAALVVMGASIGLNWWLEHGNEERIREQLARKEPLMRKEQQEQPTLGFLLLFRYKGGATGTEGAYAAPRFEVLSWRRGYTRSEAEAEFKRQPIADPSARYEFGWIEPLVAPSPLVLATPWTRVALARFTDISKIAFQKAQFKEWGGFDTNGQNGPVDARKWATDARAYRFLVLQPPPQITIRNVAGRLKLEDVDSRDVAVAGGTVPALLLDDTPAVTVWPADAPTEELFAHTDRISDKEGKLSPIANIDRMRWLRPGQVTIVQTL